MSEHPATVPGAREAHPVGGDPAQPSTDRARVWLVTGLGSAPAPTEAPTVRDDLMRTWRPGPHGRYSTGEGRHHATWSELRARHDLLEVLTETPVTELTTGGTP